MDCLYEAAKAWEELTAYRYRITHKSGEILLGFDKAEFYHLAGFQYLNDIVLPIRWSRPKTIQIVLDGKITDRHISKSKNYAMIQERLKAIIKLKEVLDSTFRLYRFNPSALPFYTKITAHNLITADIGDVVFLFTDNMEDGTAYARSIFLKSEDRDFTQRQKELKIIDVKREPVRLL